ncbi:hypothetical protein Tco_0291176, partial [Tanacetum coccineum]
MPWAVAHLAQYQIRHCRHPPTQKDAIEVMKIGKSSRIDDEVVQDQRQWVDNDLQDERADLPKEEEVEPRRCKSLRKDLVFDIDGVNSLYFFDKAVNKSGEPYDDKRDGRLGNSDGINKSPNMSPTITDHSEEVVTDSPSRHSSSSPDGLGSSVRSQKGDDATLYDDEYEFE